MIDTLKVGWIYEDKRNRQYLIIHKTDVTNLLPANINYPFVALEMDKKEFSQRTFSPAFNEKLADLFLTFTPEGRKVVTDLYNLQEDKHLIIPTGKKWEPEND